MTINNAQMDAIKALHAVFGVEHIKHKQENALRMLEEALELAQACGLGLDLVDKVKEQVYNKPIGEVKAELPQVFIQLLRIAAAEGIWLSDLFYSEMERISAPEIIEKIRQKQELKVKAY